MTDAVQTPTGVSPRTQRLELNHWADLRRVALPCTLLMPTDFDRGADWS